MTNYTNLSDFEINKRVAIASRLSNIVEDSGSVFVASDCCGENVVPIMGAFNPCNNWSDAGPIIVENKIGLSPSGEIWHAYEPDQDFVFSTENPLRAAMIVFLMTKESEQ